MPRKLRIEKNGFYHVVNRGVARNIIYLDQEDFEKFLEFLDEASDEYGFEIYSYCLMSNHYHLLMKVTKENLSQILQKVNSRYSIYFNNKYKRVGPLWQGRFKSWYVYDTHYLTTLVKYIEFNPIKANITKNIGEYRWAMSSGNVTPQGHFLSGGCFSQRVQSTRMLNFKLIESTNFDSELDENELKKIDELYKSKFEVKDGIVIKQELKELKEYFISLNFSREFAIYCAVQDGYKQIEIAEYLELSSVAVSKILKIYKQKIILFNKLRDKGIFWSYSKEVSYEEFGEKLLIEYVLKYADFDDIKVCLKLFGIKKVKNVWEDKLKSDKNFIKTNLMIARIFFSMDVESDYFKEAKNARLKKLKLLAS